MAMWLSKGGPVPKSTPSEDWFEAMRCQRVLDQYGVIVICPDWIDDFFSGCSCLLPLRWGLMSPFAI
eukprot:5431212-Heterocapsa_arctica.AAC.1